MDESAFQQLLARYPVLESLPRPLLDQLAHEAQLMRLPAGAVLFDHGSPCHAFPMLLEGSVRVIKAAPNGRELQLYRVEPGESCIITSSCLLGRAPYAARGVADGQLALVALPHGLFDQLLAHGAFRDYVFKLFSERIAELMQLVEEVAFRKLDQRLAALLLARGPVIRTTHQSLADELGSVREMVSRVLKSLADQHLVTLGREYIEIVKPDELQRLALG